MDITFPKHPELAEEVAAFMAAKGIRHTTFGKLAVGDPSLISNLREGRELRSKTIRRIRHFMMTGTAQRTSKAGAA
jgi:hypothetical protein